MKSIFITPCIKRIIRTRVITSVTSSKRNQYCIENLIFYIDQQGSAVVEHNIVMFLHARLLCALINLI